jgi:hypothetical protein
MPRPSFGGEFDAMFREMVKDIRQTAHESFYGRGEHAGEIGAPLNPTQMMTNNDLGTTAGFDSIVDKYAARGKEKEEPQKGLELGG